ncbi:hypothetical protein K439DRAFT_1658028 [Ramaria rubella]|nr:hypothetical protein K439DRAFT_1658028 [Ramaria rubella]
MSDSESLHTTLVEAALGEILQTRMNLAVLVLLSYDYLILLSGEVRLMWTAKFRTSTLLYYSVRYPLVMRKLALVIVGHSSSLPHCITFLRISDVLQASNRVAVIAVIVLRTYAICDQNRFIFVGLGLLGLGNAVIDYYSIPFDSCDVTALSRMIIMLHLANSVTRLVFDTAVLVLTLHKMIAIGMLHHRAFIRRGSSISFIILTNSSFYFGVLFTVEILNTVALFVASPSFKRFINPIPLPISAILVSRFLLELRQANLNPWTTQSLTKLTVASCAGVDHFHPSRSGRLGHNEAFTEDTPQLSGVSQDVPAQYDVDLIQVTPINGCIE